MTVVIGDAGAAPFVNFKGCGGGFNNDAECGDERSENPHPCKTRKDAAPGAG